MFSCSCQLPGLSSTLLATVIAALLYQLVIRYWSFFAKRGIRFVRGWPVLGTNYNVVLDREPLYVAMDRLYKSLPDEPLIGLYDVGGVPQYLLRDPELVKAVTIKQFDSFVNHRQQLDATVDPLAARNLFFARDQDWRDMRVTLSPAFTSSKMRGMFALVTRCGEQFVRQLRLRDSSAVLEMKDVFSRYANDTIASCAFGLEVDSLAEEGNTFYQTGLSITRQTTAFLLKFLGYATVPRLMSLLRVRLIRVEDEEYFRDVVRQTIEFRQRNNVVRNDMIDLLLQARDGVLGEGGKMKDLSETDFVAQCMIFFIAGFDTVSTLMSFMSHELAINPLVQDRVYAEINEIQQQLDGKAVTYEQLNRLTYMDQVISETLRKWPPVGTLDRVSNKTVTLDVAGKPVRIEAGDGVLIPAYGLQRDAKYWPDPDTFDPERFSEENVRNIVPGTYLPFGVGPRVCIGQRFALMETKSMFYHMLAEFRLESCERTQNPLRFGKGFGASAEKGFWLKMIRR